MNDGAAYILACHILRAVCIEKGIDCDEFCLLNYEDRPCHEWANLKMIPELLEREKVKK